MRKSPRLWLAALGAVLLVQIGCSDDDGRCVGEKCDPPVTAACGNNALEEGEQCDDGNQVGGDGCEADCSTTPVPEKPVCGNGKVEDVEVCDDGNTVDGDGCQADCSLTVTRCAAAEAPPLADGATCAVTKSGNGARLITGLVLMEKETLAGGQVLVNAQGVITCSSCDCSTAEGAAEATHVSCPTGVISPGLINAHDHVNYRSPPLASSDERYEQRLDWHHGLRNHTELNNSSAAGVDAVSFAELRHLMAGTTSIAGAGSGGSAGLLRNLDIVLVSRQEGPDLWPVVSSLYPLGDTETDTYAEGCGYSFLPRTSSLPRYAAYLPHIAEGINKEAFNEFRCVSAGANDVLMARTALVQGIALTAREIGLMADRGTGLVWTPRSNIALYGDTAMLPAFKRMGVSVALSTEWLQSGSMNMLRELKCADSLNSTYFFRAYSDQELWRMTTANAAEALNAQSRLGRIAPGMLGDLAVFSLRTFAKSPHRAVITAEPADVVLSMRGGKALYGDRTLVEALKGTSEACDTVDVCGKPKSACLQSELGKALAALQAANATAYPLFACGVPEGEPVCLPQRIANEPKWPASVTGSNVYSGETRADDRDGDGLKGRADNCPFVFNPIRPMDGGKQADSDGDGVGDACDVCPLAANSTSCTPKVVGDDDHDGIPTWQDNCPFTANADQADRDGDGKGDVCDACDVANPGNLGCPSTIHALKTPDGDRLPLEGKEVALTDAIVTGVVKGTSTNEGYWLQVHPLPSGTSVEHSGIYVYSPKADLAVGDRVDITTGVLTVYNGLPELIDVKYAKRSSKNALPAPVVVTSADVRTGGPRAAALEGVLVEVRDVVVNTAVDRFVQFLVNESGDAGQPSLMVDDAAYSYDPPVVGTRYGSLRGVLTYNFSDSKVVPRSLADLAPPLPTLTGFGPGGYVRMGGTSPVSTFPQALTLTLSGPYTEALEVFITSSNSSALRVPNGVVTVPKGQSSVEVKVEPLASAANVTLTATLRATSLQSSFRVLGAAEEPAVVGVTPSDVTVVPGGTVSFTVELDRPAPANASVALSVNPTTGFGTLTPANGVLPVALNATQASFSLTVDEAAVGPTGTVSAGIGSSSATATVTLDLTAPRLATLTPDAPVTVGYGQTQEFRVTMSSAPTEDVSVTLAATPGTGVTHFGTVPATVTVPAGATEATFLFTADALGDGTGTVSASLLGVRRSTDVTVTPPPPKLASISPERRTVYFGATQAFTMTLDRKAPAGGVVIALELAPATGLGTLPTATVTVPEGATQVQVQFTAGTTASTGTLSATYAGVTKVAEITTEERPATGHLVVNEFDYDPVGTDSSVLREFVEIYNPTSAPVSLSGVYIVLINGNGAQPTSYDKYDLTDLQVLEPGEYLVLGHPNVLESIGNQTGVKVVELPVGKSIQNGGAPVGDAIAIYDSVQNILMDSVSYTGSVSSATIQWEGGAPRGPFNFVEGPRSPTGLADANAQGSLGRKADSSDTNDNVDDFRFSPTLTPGRQNILP
ncbi:lamin tail domain-containing protein [Myxococcus stipitatus]|uniref:lamin tail domain-containing protein n=1 Tax=Myxococcus stipitatus TaxID=83455 RepID=UPI0031454A4E